MLMPAAVMRRRDADFNLKNSGESLFARPTAVCRDFFERLSGLRKQVSGVIQSLIKIPVFDFLSRFNLRRVNHFQSPFRSLKRPKR